MLHGDATGAIGTITKDTDGGDVKTTMMTEYTNNFKKPDNPALEKIKGLTNLDSYKVNEIYTKRMNILAPYFRLTP